jgi:hypothetical protein
MQYQIYILVIFSCMLNLTLYLLFGNPLSLPYSFLIGFEQNKGLSTDIRT